jgi:FdhE protein
VELRRLKAASPHLATAVDFHLALFDVDRSVRARMMLPRTLAKDALLAERLTQGQRLLEFDDLSIDWSDLRRVLREATVLLQRFEMIEGEEGDALLAIVRDAGRLPPLLRHWYDAVLDDANDASEDAMTPGQAHACLLGMRSFLAPAAAAMLQRHDVESWQRSSCPVCGGEPDFSVWSTDRRRLVCGRCCGQWTFPDGECPFCKTRGPAAGHFFSSGSRTYRVDTCDGCRRYLKGFDESHASRGFMLSVEAVATLPLDAAAQQLGYV